MIDFSWTIFHHHSHPHILLIFTLDKFQHPANCPVSRQRLQERIFKLWACKRWHWEGSIASIKSNFLSDYLLSKHAILPTNPLWRKTMPNCIIDPSKTKPGEKKNSRSRESRFGGQQDSAQQIWLFKRAEHCLCVSATTANCKIEENTEIINVLNWPSELNCVTELRTLSACSLCWFKRRISSTAKMTKHSTYWKQLLQVLHILQCFLFVCLVVCFVFKKRYSCKHCYSLQ